MEVHVHGFGSLRLYLVIYHCLCHGDFSLEGGGRLFVTQFLEYDPNADSFIGSDLKG